MVFTHNRFKVVLLNKLNFELVHFLACHSLQWTTADFCEGKGRLSDVFCAASFTAVIRDHKHAHIRIYHSCMKSLLFLGFRVRFLHLDSWFYRRLVYCILFVYF